jgi:hypothetical protein
MKSNGDKGTDMINTCLVNVSFAFDSSICISIHTDALFFFFNAFATIFDAVFISQKEHDQSTNDCSKILSLFDILEYNPSKHCQIFRLRRSIDLLAFLRRMNHQIHRRIALQLLLTDALKQRMLSEMFDHPLMQIIDIGDGVQGGARFQNERILGQQFVIDDSPTIFRAFEVRIREEKEQFREL